MIIPILTSLCSCNKNQYNKNHSICLMKKNPSIDMILTAPLGTGLGCPRVRGITGGFTLKEKSPDPGIAEGSHARQQPFRSVTPVLFIRMLCLPKAVTSELHAYFHICVLFTHSKFHPFTVHSWVSLSACIQPCNHHHNPDEDHPFTLRIPVPPCLHSLSPTNLR